MRLILATLLSLAAVPAAGDFSLAFPLDCTLGDDCYIQQFVDHDPSADSSDFQCGTLTYDGHKGTDFALPTLADQTAGVAVLAAASGEVRGVRNDVADVLQGSDGAPDVSDIECGNGVLLRHPDGWETQYCHMARGSIAVAVGDTVTTGQTLGLVGLSGATQFPHLHVSVRQNGRTVDPFDPDGEITCGAPSAESLWDTPLPAPAGGIITSGFATMIPDYDAVKSGTASITEIPSNGAALVFWGYGFGTQAGDVLELRITGPQGVVFENSETLERTQAQMFRAGGKRTPQSGWPVGDYSGEVTLLRGGVAIDRDNTVVSVVDR